MKIPRWYQSEDILTVQQALEEGHKRQLLVYATGLGKTFTAVTIAQDFKRILWLTHTEDLIEQSAMAIIENILDEDHAQHVLSRKGLINYLKTHKKNSLFGVDLQDQAILDSIGMIKEDIFNIDTTFVVASVQTLHRRLERIPKDHFDLIVVDEAHLSAASTWSKSIEHFEFELLLGLTATPHRADGVSLTNLFDPPIRVNRDISWGIKNGFLCELDAYRVKTSNDLTEIKTVAGDFNQAQLGKVINTPERNALIVAKYEELASGRPFIVFGLDVQHAMDLNNAFIDKGHKTTFVVADEKLCPDRRDRIHYFKSGRYMGLVNVNILTAGFDFPGIECVIMARPTKSLTLYLQCIGRGTRLKPSGKNCIILDIVDVTGKHSLINTWTLEQNTLLEDRIFLSKERKEALIEKRDKQRKLDKEILRDTRVNLLELPEIKFYDTEANRAEATKAQLELMKRLGFDVEGQAWTKGQCTEVISNQKIGDEKIDKLKQWGYKVSGDVTLGQFVKAEQQVAQKGKFERILTSDNKIKLPFKNLK